MPKVNHCVVIEWGNVALWKYTSKYLETRGLDGATYFQMVHGWEVNNKREIGRMGGWGYRKDKAMDRDAVRSESLSMENWHSLHYCCNLPLYLKHCFKHRGLFCVQCHLPTWSRDFEIILIAYYQSQCCFCDPCMCPVNIHNDVCHNTVNETKSMKVHVFLTKGMLNVYLNCLM